MPHNPPGFILRSLCVLVCFTIAGCAQSITSGQKAELNAYRTKGMEVTEKDPDVAKALGILPGGGSFYVGDYRSGIINLILWPTSIIWDPISGSNGAIAANYRATRQAVDNSRGAAMHDINTRFEQGELTETEYLTERERIERKYAPEL